MRTPLVLWLVSCFVLLISLIVAVQQSSTSASQASSAQKSSDDCTAPPNGGPTGIDPCHYLRFGPGVVPPKALDAPSPDLPENVCNKHIQGMVILAIGISAGGNVEVVKVRRSLDPEVDETAVRTIRQWKFAPAEKAGQPVASQVMVEVNFPPRSPNQP